MPLVTPSLYPRTALMVIEDALALTNSVGVDQTLTAQEVTWCLRRLNDLIEIWSTQTLAVYAQATQTFNTVANQGTYTIGPQGDWNTTRPIRINEPVYATVSSVTFPYVSINQQQYDLIAFKSQSGGGTDVVQYFLYVNDNPLGRITLWPVPDAVIPITLDIDVVLDYVPTGATVMAFPPGYFHAFTHNLAPILSPRFGKKASDEVKAEALKSFGNIKRANQTPIVLQYESSLLSTPYGSGYPGYP